MALIGAVVVLAALLAVAGFAVVILIRRLQAARTDASRAKLLAAAPIEKQDADDSTDALLQPPSVNWVPTRRYACFLSHYKLEAGTDARYLKDLLQRMLRAPVFLDSSRLTDLRNLFEQGVRRSDVLLLLATRSVLTRPWVLCELWEILLATLRSRPSSIS